MKAVCIYIYAYIKVYLLLLIYTVNQIYHGSLWFIALLQQVPSNSWLLCLSSSTRGDVVGVRWS